MFIRRLLPGVLFVALLPAVAATSPAPFGDAWRWVHFTTASGLPSNFVTSVVEIPGSGVWAITRTGIARFDGFRWHGVPAPKGTADQPDSIVADGRGGVVVVGGGRLLVGNADGLRAVAVSDGGRPLGFTRCARAATGPILLLGDNRVIYEWDGQTCRPHPASRILGPVNAMKRAGGSSVWVSAERGLSCWEGTRWRLRLPGRDMLMYGVFEGQDQSAIAYVESPLSERGLWEWKGRSGPHPVRRELITLVQSIAVAPDGETLIVHNTGEVMLRDGARWTPLPQAGARILDARATGFLANRDLWIATDHGLALFRRGSTLWQMTAIPRPDDRNTINEIVPLPDGRIALATGRGVIDTSPLGTVRDIPLSPSDVLGRVTGLAMDGRGRLWATSGDSFTGARWRDASGRWHTAHLDPELDAAFLHKVIVDRRGGVWFLGLSNASWQPSTGPADGVGAFRLAAPRAGGAESVER